MAARVEHSELRATGKRSREKSDEKEAGAEN
jgi:hypothetical protein